MYFAFFKNVYSASSWNHFFKGTSANHKVAISPHKVCRNLLHKAINRMRGASRIKANRRAEHLRISALPILRNFSLSDLQLATLQIHLRIKKSSKKSLY